MLRAFFVLVSLAVLTTASFAQAFQTRASSAYVIDHGTGTVLLSKNADVPLPPASMSKLMTLNMLFEALEDGRVTMDTTFRVSAKASAKGGSKMFLRDGERVQVADLIPGIIVQSGNDACIVVAEGLAGSEDAFAALMTERAKALGMTGSTFANASGWPHPGHRMSMHDLAILADRMITEFPQYYTMFSQQSFTWADITQRNRNPLLGLVPGADGLKTGHTQEAGYGLVGSAKQGDRRIVFVISGLESEAARAEEAERIVNWAFRQFVEKTVVTQGTQVATVPVHMGAVDQVGLSLPSDVRVLLPATARETVTGLVTYTAPLTAPLTAGQEVGTLTITAPGLAETTHPIVVAQDVAPGGFMVRLRTAARVLIQSLASQAATVE